MSLPAGSPCGAWVSWAPRVSPPLLEKVRVFFLFFSFLLHDASTSNFLSLILSFSLDVDGTVTVLTRYGIQAIDVVRAFA